MRYPTSPLEWIEKWNGEQDNGTLLFSLNSFRCRVWKHEPNHTRIFPLRSMNVSYRHFKISRFEGIGSSGIGVWEDIKKLYFRAGSQYKQAFLGSSPFGRTQSWIRRLEVKSYICSLLSPFHVLQTSDLSNMQLRPICNYVANRQNQKQKDFI